MRSTFSLFGILTTTLFAVAVPLTAHAQTAPSTPEFGYYVPVLVDDGGVVNAGYSLHISDDEEDPVPQPMADLDEPALPMVSPGGSGGCAVGCDCGGCDSRFRGGCKRSCSCLRCRHDRLFTQSFGSLEFLHWYNEGINLPPLVTSNGGAIPAQADAGVLGRNGTRILFGNAEIDEDRQNGARLTFGWWLDDCCNLAVGARLYDVEGGAFTFDANSVGDTVLAIPFFNRDPLVNAEDALLLAYPGLSAGSISVRAENDMIGGEIFGRSLLDSGCDYRVDLVGGYQFAQIDSSLSLVSQTSTGAADFAFSDLFDVENQFHGFAAGVYGEKYHDIWTLSALSKIAIGNMRQTVNIQGSNSVTAGGTVTTPGGLFAQPTNIGVHQNDELVWSPEANIKLSCAVTRQLSVSVGYSFLYFSQVAFAGDQLDRNVNATQLNGGAVVGPNQPAFVLRDNGFWIQSVDVGVSYNY